MRRNPTLLRALDEPLRLYFRAGQNDHRAFERTLAGGMPPFSGAVLDASRTKRHSDLRAELRSRGLEAVLDPMMLELATSGGWERESLHKLPWAGEERHRPERSDMGAARRVADQLVEFAVRNRYTAIIAPTHFLQDGINDAWWRRDRDAAMQVAKAVGSMDAQNRPRLYYRIAAPRKVLVDSEQREEMIRVLADLPVDAVWLCVHPVGASSGSTAARSYANICADLKRIRKPLVAERTGVLGTAMLAFGAVIGMESGITNGENFDANRLLRPRPPRADDSGYAMAGRVYIERLGIFLKREEAQAFFARHGMKGRFGCQGRACCRDVDDMIRDPLRHFLVTRAEEITTLANVPRHDRAAVYMERFLRRASDDAVSVARLDPKKFERVEKRIRGWRLVFGGLLEERATRAEERKHADVIPLRAVKGLRGKRDDREE